MRRFWEIPPRALFVPSTIDDSSLCRFGSLLFHHTVGKTIRDADGHLLVVPRVEDEPSLCPVLAFDDCVTACVSAGVDIRSGYLFPPLAGPHSLTYKDIPFSSNTAMKRLRLSSGT